MPIHRPVLTACTLVALTVPAHAEITVSQSEYAAGVLVVRGETSQPRQRVTLDGRFDTRTNANSEFVFRVRYLPPDCTADIRAGREVHPVVITNCRASGTVNPAKRSSRAGSPAATAGAGTRIANEGVGSESLSVRTIRQPCEADKDCMVMCPERAFALNAFCSGGSARLIGERSVACPAGRGHIVAYCAAPADDRAEGANR